MQYLRNLSKSSLMLSNELQAFLVRKTFSEPLTLLIEYTYFCKGKRLDMIEFLLKLN